MSDINCRKVFWACEGCGVQVVLSNEAPYDGDKAEENDAWIHWHGGEKVHYAGSGITYAYPSSAIYKGYKVQVPTEAPYEVNGKSYCPGCAQDCSECGSGLFRRTDLQDDTYDAGTSFTHPDHWDRAVCVDCLEKLETEKEAREKAEEEEDDGSKE